MTSSRLPIGVGQTTSLPGISRSPCSSSIRAIAAAPIIPASWPSSAASDRGLVHRRQRPLAQLRAAPAPAAGRRPRSRRRRHDHVRLEDVGEAGEATPRRLPISSKTPIAVSSPASAASVTALPSISCPRRASCRAPSPARFRPRPAPSRPSAVPEASDSTQPWSGQLPWQGGPSASITCGRARRRPGRAAVDLAAEDQAAADPGADVSITALSACRARRRRGTRRGGDVGVVVDEDRQAERSETRSRIGRSAIGRLTAETATPLSWSIVAGMPSPTAGRRAGFARLARSRAPPGRPARPRPGRSRPRGSPRGRPAPRGPGG